MPINSNLIQGAQSLFGVRADLKFGNTTISGVFSEQRSQSQNITSQGGGKLQEFSLYALDYEEDRHYFISQYFRDNYDTFLANYPYINSPVQINRIEVWVTNRGYQTQNVRNIIALQDLGEANPNNSKLDDSVSEFFFATNPKDPPSNNANKLDPDEIGFQGVLNENIRDIATVNNGFNNVRVSEGRDYAVLESARKLNSKEYTFHPQLGYISLNQRLSNDEILGVAFQYTYLGKVYRVGEFANGDIPGTSIIQQNQIPGQTQVPQQIQTNNLIVKMLKSSLTDVRQPVWDLMMKNIYNTGAFQLSEEDFRLNILYTDPSPINYLTPIDPSIWPNDLDEEILLNTMELDRLNAYQDIVPKGDGFFDFVPQITVIPENGKIIFTKAEPFGSYLFETLRLDPSESYESDESIPGNYNANQSKYVYKSLYSSTKTAALQDSEKNKFQIKGSFKSSGDVGGISIGQFNIPRGSVKVTAGGRLLQEGLDYTVNYQAGRVQILDESLKNSSVPIEISTESNSFYSQQKKRFSGINIEHKFNENFIIGGTLMNLSERSISQKANYGVEPVNNTMIGFNGTFSSKVPFLTRLVNKLPNINTEVESNVSFTTEFAYLHSGTPKNSGFDNVATVYVDDFEGSETSIDLKDTSSWNLSSTPLNVKGSDYGVDDLRSGYNRGKLAWYNIDPIFYTRQRPSEINENEISKNETRRIFKNLTWIQKCGKDRKRWWGMHKSRGNIKSNKG